MNPNDVMKFLSPLLDLVYFSLVYISYGIVVLLGCFWYVGGGYMYFLLNVWGAPLFSVMAANWFCEKSD